MQIILVQAEIEAAIRALINSRFNSDIPMSIELAATRKETGFTATIEIAHEHLFPARVIPAMPVLTTSPVPQASPAAETTEVVEGYEAFEAATETEDQSEAAEEQQTESMAHPPEENQVSQEAENPAPAPARPRPSIFGRPKLVEVPAQEPEPVKTGGLATTPEENEAMLAQIRAELAAEEAAKEKDQSMAEENAAEAEKVDPPFEVTAQTKVTSTDEAPAQAAQTPPAGERRSLFKGLKRPSNG